MHLMCALLVNLQQGAYEQHRSTRSTHHRGHGEARTEDKGIDNGCSRNIATYAYATRNHKERKEQHHKGYVVVEDVVHDSATQAE